MSGKQQPFAFQFSDGITRMFYAPTRRAALEYASAWAEAHDLALEDD